MRQRRRTNHALGGIAAEEGELRPMGIIVARRGSAGTDGRGRVLLGRSDRSKVDLALIANRLGTPLLPGYEGIDEQVLRAGRCVISSGNETSSVQLLLRSIGVLK
jgi:hypothetical protein